MKYVVKERQRAAFKRYDREKMFREISERVNYLDVEMVKRVYFELLRVIIKDLREGKVVSLPNWGRFYLRKLKAQRRYNAGTKIVYQDVAKTSLQFSTEVGLRKYLQQVEID
jgi:nucleoid DNA-binding protein